MRLWSEQAGGFIEAESTWNGRDSLTSGEGFQMRGSYLTDASITRTHVIRDQPKGKSCTQAAAFNAKAKADLAEQAGPCSICAILRARCRRCTSRLRHRKSEAE